MPILLVRFIRDARGVFEMQVPGHPREDHSAEWNTGVGGRDLTRTAAASAAGVS